MASLPRFITLLTLDSASTFVQLTNFAGNLSFSSNQITHLTVHEVIPNVYEDDGTFTIRSANGNFWRRRDDGYILADQEITPEATDMACYFKAVALTSATVLQSVLDGLYLKRYNGAITNGYCAATATVDIYSQMLVTAMDSMVITLPSPMALIPRDGSSNFLSLNTGSGQLTFTSAALTSLTTHEVVDTTEDGAVSVRSQNGMFWRRRDDGYIVADREATPQASDKECYFKPFRYNNLTVFMSILDGNYLKRYNGDIQNGFRAATLEVDSYSQMLVSGYVASSVE